MLSLKGIGPRTVLEVIRKHRGSLLGTVRLDANFAESLNVGKVNRALQASQLSWEELEESAYDILDSADSIHARVLNPCSPMYPKRLLVNKNFPPILYCLGDLSAIDPEKSVAMVGTRNPTDFGARMGRRLAELFAADEYVVVSGLALGCDTMAHEGALDAKGRTVAVLPTPIGSRVYPKQNQELSERILASGGALVTEYPPNMQLSEKQLMANLVTRDEWQPGLADGLVAFETSIDGGTRHAMKHAQDTGTPIAVFDYSSRESVDFKGDKRFSGNVEYLQSGKASRIFERQTISDFKKRMEAYRGTSKPELAHGNPNLSNVDAQIPLMFD